MVFTMTRLFSILHLRAPLAGLLGTTVMMVVGLRLGSIGWDQGPGAAWLVSLGIPVAALLVTLLIFAVALRPQTHLQDMNRMLAGQSWAHWHYDEADWKAANDIEGRREQEQRNSCTAPLLALAVGLVMVAAGAAAGAHGVIVIGVTIAFVALLYIMAVGVALLRHGTLMARSRPRGEVYIGPLGVYRRPGGYAALYEFGFRLREVDFIDATNETPACLRFTVRAKGELWPLTDVAVPPGREEEARALVQRFQTEVLTSR
ncbi:hypothetical protein ABZ260_46735 [Streptosporangium sp. NPDC006013]|uniref:hypothetical protein n=1 Tax=Streptosporangium sp. NPDC006013 TaxID=3155596 RepID=UPI0033AD2516